MSEHEKVAAVGDLQLPYGDYRAISLWFTMMKWWKPTTIVAVGDIDDQLEYSTFSDGTTDEFFNVLAKNEKENARAEAARKKELEKASVDEILDMPAECFKEPLPTNPLPFVRENAAAARTFYTDVRNQHKKSRFFSCLGNHDIRIYKYMDRKAPDYKDEIHPDFLYDFKNLGIDWIDYSARPIELVPGTYFHHGTTISSSGAAVRGDIDNYGVSMVRGHDHMGAVVYKTFPMTQQTLFGLSCGHLCDPHAYGLKYTNNPTWQMGFGVMHVYGNEVHPQFINIKPDYTAVLDGKFFQG